MSRLTFMLDGRQIAFDTLAEQRSVDAVDRVMLMAVGKHVQRRLRSLECREHRRPPHVIAHGPSPERLTFVVDGCCDALVTDATEALQPDSPRIELALAS